MAAGFLERERMNEHRPRPSAQRRGDLARKQCRRRPRHEHLGASRVQQPAHEPLRGGAEPETADVRQVGDAHRVVGDPAVAEHRPHHVDVEEMARAHPGVVGVDHVARLERIRREFREHVAQGRGCGAGERRHAVAPLGNRVPLRVEDHDRQVPALAHDGRERAADEGGDDLVGDPDQPIPHDGKAHRVDRVGAHESLSSFASSATRFRRAPTVARSPGPSTQVDSRSSMTAGPSTVVPTSSA